METLITFITILGIAAVIAIISFVLYRIMNPKLKEDKPSEEQFLQEEMDRVLQPVEDEATARQINNYRDEEDEE